MPLRATSLLLLFVLAASARATAPEEIELGRSVEGRPIVARVFGEADAAETLWVLASIHGSEPAGTPLIERLEAWLLANPGEWADQRVVITPIGNPDGYAIGERHNKNGVDLNRNFPAPNREEKAVYGAEALSEPEAVALMNALERFKPVRVVSLHQPLECVDYDGPGAELAEAMSAAIDRRLPVKKLGGRPGSLGSYVGMTLGAPIITLELPKGVEQHTAEELWADYGAALVAFLRGVGE